ncbi:AAA family ATPase [Paracoccus spongiarum]|uniref:AAA family ATPase n=1 Tax=Paracoccus spongiarum TaxID=3064387 RepID=A0ABT9J9M3_9RHOB|nr:AAA family ATPase [Paracoccus sp. 2205BS29-5]MDP5306503.1 AAA family ATPase [Paracoccus sp. 2205BS29-5]
MIDLSLQPGRLCPAFRAGQNFVWMYPAIGHRTAMTTLENGVTSGHAVTLLTGDPGSGKSLMLRALAARFQQDERIAWIDGADDEGEDPFAAEPEAEAGDELSADLRQFLDEGGTAQPRGLLIVDNGEELSDAALDQLRRLARLHEEGALRVPIVIAGLPELRARLAAQPRPGLYDLIRGQAHLPAFRASETAGYVAHRLVNAQCPCHEGVSPFDQASLQVLHQASQGVPGVLNQMAQICLRDADAAGLSRITAAFAEKALRDARDGPAGIAARSGQPPQPGTGAAADLPTAAGRDKAGAPARDSAPVPLSAPATLPAPVTLPAPATLPAPVTLSAPATLSAPVALAAPIVAPAGPADLPPRQPLPSAAAARPRPAPPRAAPSEGSAPPRRSLRFLLISGTLAAGVTGGLLWYGAQGRTDAPAGMATPEGAAPPPADAPADAPGARPEPLEEARAPGPDSLPPAWIDDSAPMLRISGGAAPPDAKALLDQGLQIGRFRPQLATFHYQRAALRGNPRAASFLGQAFEIGDGVPADARRALAWYRLAGNLGGAPSRVAALQDVAAGPSTLPAIPVAQVLFADGGVEIHWRAPRDESPARFAVEYLRDGEEAMPNRQETDLSAILLDGPVHSWRIATLDDDGSELASTGWIYAVPPPG